MKIDGTKLYRKLRTLDYSLEVISFHFSRLGYVELMSSQRHGYHKVYV